MRMTRSTRWILALIMMAIACQALVFVPVAAYSAIVFWGLSLVFLVAALVVAVKRRGRG